MATQGDMKTRIAQEMRRDDLTTEIANAISTAIAFYQYEAFPTFNQTSLQAAPASDSEAANPWMNAAEPLIRNRAKGLLYHGVMKLPDMAKMYFDLANEWRDQLKISNLKQTLSSTTAGTLGRMKYRIANEIGRGDLTNEIADAIETAMDYYESDRFYFTETRSITWNTVASQYIYTSTDIPDLANLIKIDYMFAYIANQPYRVTPLQPDEQEWSHLSANDPVGQPGRFTYFAQSLSIYPTPDQIYSMRIGGAKIIETPATDATTGNPWMTVGEGMIRARAKAELYTHIPSIANPEMAAQMAAAAAVQFDQLKSKTVDLEVDGDFIIEAWGY